MAGTIPIDATPTAVNTNMAPTPLSSNDARPTTVSAMAATATALAIAQRPNATATRTAIHARC